MSSIEISLTSQVNAPADTRPAVRDDNRAEVMRAATLARVVSKLGDFSHGELKAVERIIDELRAKDSRVPGQWGYDTNAADNGDTHRRPDALLDPALKRGGFANG